MPEVADRTEFFPYKHTLYSFSLVFKLPVSLHLCFGAIIKGDKGHLNTNTGTFDSEPDNLDRY